MTFPRVQGRNKITKHVEREVICHSNFCHPHVIQFKEIFLTPTHLAIAMEYAPGGDMFQFVKRSSGLKVLATYLTASCILSLHLNYTYNCFLSLHCYCNHKKLDVGVPSEGLKPH